MESPFSIVRNLTDATADGRKQQVREVLDLQAFVANGFDDLDTQESMRRRRSNDDLFYLGIRKWNRIAVVNLGDDSSCNDDVLKASTVMQQYRHDMIAHSRFW